MSGLKTQELIFHFLLFSLKIVSISYNVCLKTLLPQLNFHFLVYFFIHKVNTSIWLSEEEEEEEEVKKKNKKNKKKKKNKNKNKKNKKNKNKKNKNNSSNKTIQKEKKTEVTERWTDWEEERLKEKEI
ncbi:hypothetical protein ElyMa_000059400 [Elysia marginata]|uniref:Uncharacterized protein n=1 Tax=Elysia marginata TaxID=1093978 RepID=A0AAV4EGQ3_9GAST|nr:hypothetical protein ElyMa_000059400 [Elysia marginata]